MTSTFRSIPFLFALALGATGAGAQDLPDSVHVLPPVLVEAWRPSSFSPGVRSVRLRREELAEADLLRVLEREAGFFALRSGTGTALSLRVRGTDDLQTTVLLDGIALRDPQTGSLDPALIPRVVLESVEIGTGAAAADPGSSTGPGLGGTIRFTSSSSGRCGGGRAEGSAGAYGERRIGGRFAVGSKPMCVLLAAEHGEARGDFPVPVIAGAPDRRLGARRRHDSGFASISGSTRSIRWSLTGWKTTSEAGLPGPANSTPRGAEMGLTTWRGAASVRRTGTRIAIGLNLQTGRSRSIFRDPVAERRSEAEASSLQAEAFMVASLGRWSIESRAILGSDRSFVPVSVSQRRAVADLAATLSGRKGEVMLGIAAGEWPGAGIQVTPRLSAAIGGRWSLRGSVARAVRPPTLAERTWVPGGNPDLRPETGWSADSGIRYISGTGWTLGLGVYANILRDRIVWQPGLVAPGLDVWTPLNIGRSLGIGVEPSIERQIPAAGGHVRLQLSSSISRTTDRSDRLAASFGHAIRHLPGSIWTLVAEWSAGPGALRLDGRRVGRRPVTTDESRHLASFTVFDLSGSLSPERRIRIRASLRNLFGARYVLIPQYPMPGRHLILTITLDV